jgi:site-specific DNA recombinase
MKPASPILTDTAPKSVGIWIRVSTEDQAQGESPAVHERRARLYAEAKGWKVEDVFHLEGVSGKAVMDHPEAKRMLEAVRSGRITGLIFSKLARLARNTKELLDFSDQFRAAGADLISLQEAIDTGSPAGRFFFTLLSAMCQWEREEIADRVSASIPIRAKMGHQIGGQAPFGYRWKNKKLEPDPQEAPVRRLIHELFAEHKRKKTVARILTERGYRTRSGKPFTDTTLARLLEDTTAKGTFRANFSKLTPDGKSRTLKPESEWVYTQVEPIVDEALWDTCFHILDSHRRGYTKASRKTVHLFSGFAYCACGSKMYVWSHSPTYRCGKCRRKIPTDDLEAIYRDRLGEFLVSPDEIAAHNAAANDVIADKEKLVRAAESELQKLTSDDKRMMDLYLSGELSKEEFGRHHRPLAERRAQLEDELPRLQASLDVLKIDTISKAEAASEATTLATHWGTFSFDDKRAIIEAITEKIVIGNEEVAINLLYRPSGPTSDKRATPPSPCGRVEKFERSETFFGEGQEHSSLRLAPPRSFLFAGAQRKPSTFPQREGGRPFSNFAFATSPLQSFQSMLSVS